METLKNKIILITGAGQGLGEATSRVLAKEGAIILAADIQYELVVSLIEDLIAQGYQGEAFHLDVTNDDSIQKVLDTIMNSYGHIDVLINNAGIDVTKPIEEIAIEEFDHILSVNLRAPFILSKSVLPFMKHSGGSIVNIISTAAKRAWVNASAYHASKWGLLGLSYALHVEGRKKHIRVSAVVAGGMKTPFILNRFPDTPLEVLQNPERVAEIIKCVLLVPEESVVPEVMVLPMQETSWP